MSGAVFYPPASRVQWFGDKYDRPRIRPNVLVLHTTEGSSWPGYSGGGEAPHLTYDPKSRQWRQHFPLDVAAMALVDAPGGVATNRLNCVQVEIQCTDGWATTENPKRGYTVGLHVRDLSDDNLRDLADLWRFLNAEWDVPFEITPRGFQPWNGRRPTMTNDEWNSFRGLCGHQHVPENDHTDPGVINAGRILELARGNAAVSPRPAPVLAMPVTGRIGQRYAELGGPAGPLGQPVGGEVITETGAWTPFENGVMLWSPATDARENRGAIREAYGRHGFERGHLGYPITDEFVARDNGRGQHYEHGSIYWHPNLGAQVVYGSILDKWAATGWENGPLGYPLGEEFDGARLGGRVQLFQGGVVYWTPASGAWPVWGTMLEQYGRDGYEAGRWGYPGGPENRVGDSFFQGFDGGIMRVDPPRPAARVQTAQAVPASKYIRPIRDANQFPISAAYGIPGNLWAAGHHTGVDIAAPIGTPVYATIGGDVRTGSRSWGPAYGNLLIINDDEDGSDWGYGHLSRHAVREGQHVETGQLIGYVGDTGHVTGPHLHLERRPRQGDYGSDKNPNLWP